MLRFENIEYFWLLLLVVLVIVLFIFAMLNKQSRLKKIGDESLVTALIPTFSSPRTLFRFILLGLALIIGIVGLANLQAGSRSEKIERKGIDVMIALDVSKSMLAKDVSPNRLEKAKQFISKLFEKLPNDRIGLILFAGRAYTSVPLTIDYSALKMNLFSALFHLGSLSFSTVQIFV
jgi:Ca-activated chloride channel family protein